MKYLILNVTIINESKIDFKEICETLKLKFTVLKTPSLLWARFWVITCQETFFALFLMSGYEHWLHSIVVTGTVRVCRVQTAKKCLQRTFGAIIVRAVGVDFVKFIIPKKSVVPLSNYFTKFKQSTLTILVKKNLITFFSKLPSFFQKNLTIS